MGRSKADRDDRVFQRVRRKLKSELRQVEFDNYLKHGCPCEKKNNKAKINNKVMVRTFNVPKIQVQVSEASSGLSSYSGKAFVLKSILR
jgi:hypothetical protein